MQGQGPTTNSRKNAACSASSAIPKPRTSPTSGCMRFSIAARRARASPHRTAREVRISKSMGHVADAFSEKTLEKLPGHHRDRARALFDRRRQQRRQRAADPDRVRARADCHRAQRQSRQRQRAQGRARPARGDLSDQHRYRSDSAPVRAIARDDDRRGDRRGDFARAGCLLARADDERSAHRRARSARIPSAGARASRRRRHRVLGDVRARSDRRDLRSRRRAGRSRSSSARPA